MKRGGESGVLEFREANLAGAAETRAFLAAALTCGFKLAGGGYPMDDMLNSVALDLVEFEALRAQGKVTRVVHLVFDLKVKATLAGEEIDIYEFRRRFEDAAWCAAHSEHPIACLRHFVATLRNVSAALVGQKPVIHLKRGKREALLIQPGDPRYNEEKNNQLLEWFAKGWQNEPFS